jgi:hypothetical protein
MLTLIGVSGDFANALNFLSEVLAQFRSCGAIRRPVLLPMELHPVGCSTTYGEGKGLSLEMLIGWIPVQVVVNVNRN